MNWSMDISEAPASPQLCVPPAGKHMLSPHVPLDSNRKSRTESGNSDPSVLNYGNNQPSITSSWNGAHHALSIFRTDKTSNIDITNIALSITRLTNYLKHNLANKKAPAREFTTVVKALWGLIASVYSMKWNLLSIEDKSIHKLVGEKILPGYLKLRLLNEKAVEKSSSSSYSVSLPSNMVVPPPPPTATSVVISPLPIPVAPLKVPKPSNIKKSYVQASKINILSNVENILRVKEVFLFLSANKVGKILKVKNSSEGKKKLKLNMTTRGLSRKEVIIPMAKLNTELIVKSAHIHVTNLNECLKNSKTDIIADFIHMSKNGIIITTNHPASPSELSRIKDFLKKINNINLDSIESPCLPKSKSFMKIVGLPYNSKREVLTPDFIKGILKEIHLFKDVMLASKPHVIKASPKSNMAVVWVDI